MTIFELRKKTIAALLLAFLASAVLPACSSDDEEAPPANQSYDECMEQADSAQEKERCTQELDI